MTWVVLAALLFGAGSLTQSVATARRGVPSLRAVLVHPLFLLGTAIEGLGALAHVVALQSVSLAVAQCAISGSLVVTAVGARVCFGTRLGADGVAAIAVTTVGLVVLSAFSGSAGTLTGSPAVEIGLAVATLMIAGLAIAGLGLLGLHSTHRGTMLAVVSGLGFAAFSIGVRFLDTSSLPSIVTDPAVLVVALAGTVGCLFWTLALRTAPVTVVTAVVVVAEVVPPSLLGPLLGDQVQSGFAIVAPLVLIAIALSARVLARVGTVIPETATPETAIPETAASGTTFAAR